jgi:glycosyltransferase involved in cell wall biosynthesis
MKILIITSPNPYKTAGIAALDLYKGLIALNSHQVKMLVKAWGKYSDKNIISFETTLTNILKRIFQKLRGQFVKLNVLSDKKIPSDAKYSIQDYNQTITYYSTKSILKKVDYIPDVILVLFMQEFISYRNLFELNSITHAPIFLYLMDMAPITGGCHYAWDCKGYLNNCGNCPAMYSSVLNDQSRINWLFKKEHIQKTNIKTIAASEYQYRQLIQSSLFKEKPNHKILLGIDGNIFRIGDKKQARASLNLPFNMKIIFFGAMGFSAKRKGYDELIKALRIFKDEIFDTSIIHLAIAGNATEELKAHLPFDYSLLGYLTHKDLALAFQAADLFLCTSIEDSGPMMINQSIMCGTPVVAFEMGVALDLVITGKTGYRAKLKDCIDLANGIEYILKLDDNEYNTIRDNCKKIGFELLQTRKQASSFMQLINNSMEEKMGPSST